MTTVLKRTWTDSSHQSATPLPLQAAFPSMTIILQPIPINGLQGFSDEAYVSNSFFEVLHDS
ncbi:hypothetical protein [Xanthomonas fragariae]|uniref:hypothetical protein n=1 Tax=Xanthomonas fragariae TaxID=48664 RepID=UPI001EE05BA7|nr:hypothetical protein [Xanthomonas fragariae]UKR52514.1 hypothetical protein K4A87_18635 [Xanthomonas fragariae]